MTVGTVAYAAPEQLMGEEIDGRADQYALAATAFHLLTGSQLFPHSNPAVVISRHLNSPPPRLADTRPELAAWDSVLAAALAKDPDDRFPRCADFARALAEQAVTGASNLWIRLPCTPLISVGVMGFPFKTNDNDSNTWVLGCGATAIWNSSVVGAVMSTSSCAPTTRLMSPMMPADRTSRGRATAHGSARLWSGPAARSNSLPEHGSIWY
jgi:serine/threonine protein kinase